jgi:capsular polysaccharide biosynthesis protein
MRAITPIVTGRWIVMALCVAALVFLAGLYEVFLILPKIYCATAEIEIVPPGNNPNFSAVRDFEIMQSGDFLKPIVADLNLDHIWAKRVYQSSLDQLPMQDALAYLAQITRYDIISGTNIIHITVASEVPKEAADIANAIADRFSSSNLYDPQGRDGARIISRAEPPEYPTKPDKALDSAIAFGIAILAGLLVATLLEIFLRTTSRGMPVPPADFRPPEGHRPSLDY